MFYDEMLREKCLFFDVFKKSTIPVKKKKIEMKTDFLFCFETSRQVIFFPI